MRINKYIALATGMSRRSADELIKDGKVKINGRPAYPYQRVSEKDKVLLSGEALSLPSKITTIILNKPVGYVTSREGQGSKTVYDLLPKELHNLKPVGRLDKDSSGLLIMTNDGELANQLTHPRYGKEKVYDLTLDKQLPPIDLRKINEGIKLQDGTSCLTVKQIKGADYQVKMSEGRNRQIRRTFSTLGYEVKRLHRVRFGKYQLKDLSKGKYKQV